MPVSGDIPSDILFHLPEWCCFVSAPGRVFEEEVLGFLASLNSDSEGLPPELWLLVVYKEEDGDVEPLCLTLVGASGMLFLAVLISWNAQSLLLVLNKRMLQSPV
jgi:hypothetical protein